ncbi:MAG: hypothetical protein GEU81_13520 [Nitriliruptorales bacterium]|nr:hypothetical protein [Nitriliruptorales bacterium]
MEQRPRYPASVASVRAQLAAGADARMTALLQGTVYATRTPCHDRLVQVTESEMEQGRRQVTVRCPGCSAIWQASVYAPVVHWQR